jgi:transposase
LTLPWTFRIAILTKAFRGQLRIKLAQAHVADHRTHAKQAPQAMRSAASSGPALACNASVVSARSSCSLAMLPRCDARATWSRVWRRRVVSQFEISGSRHVSKCRLEKLQIAGRQLTLELLRLIVVPAMSFLVAGTVKRCCHRSVRESSFPVFGLLLGEIFQRATRRIDCKRRRPSPRERPRKQQVCMSNVARSANLTPVIGCCSCETHESKTFACCQLWLLDQIPGSVIAPRCKALLRFGA